MLQYIQENGIFLCDPSFYHDSLLENSHSHIRFVTGQGIEVRRQIYFILIKRLDPLP